MLCMPSKDYHHSFEFTQTPDVDAQLEQADELLRHPLLNSFTTNSFVEARNNLPPHPRPNTTSSWSDSASPITMDSEEERMKSPTLPKQGAAEMMMIVDPDVIQVCFSN